MTPAVCEVLALAKEAGVKLALTREGLRFEAPEGAVTPDLLAKLRDAKPTIIASGRVTETPVPDHEIPLTPKCPELTQAQEDALCRHFEKCQLPEAWRWVMGGQHNRYRAYFSDWRDASGNFNAWDWAAALDLVAWQRGIPRGKVIEEIEHQTTAEAPAL